MTNQNEDRLGTLRWLISLPPVPRSLLLGLFTLWWISFGLGWYLAEITTPNRDWWYAVWDGGLGGNGFSAFGAIVLSLLITAEVMYMVLTYLGNRRRLLDAEKKAARKVREAAEQAMAKGVKEGREQGLEQGREQGREQGLEQGLEQGREQGRREARQEWADWLASVRADLEAGRPPSVPPPSGNGSNQSG